MHANNRKRTQSLAQGEPAWGVGDGGLTSQPAQLQSFGLFHVGRLWVIGQCNASQKNWGPGPKDKGGDGVPWQGHHGEGLLEVEVLDWGCCHRWQPFHCINWYSICPSANFFYFNKIGWFSAVLCDFLKIIFNIPDLSLPPCIPRTFNRIDQ